MFQASEEIKTNALRVIHVFLEIKKENMLVILQEESTEAFWEALRCAASIFERTKFNELLKDLPFGSDVMTLLSSNGIDTLSFSFYPLSPSPSPPRLIFYQN